MEHKSIQSLKTVRQDRGSTRTVASEGQECNVNMRFLLALLLYSGTCLAVVALVSWCPCACFNSSRFLSQ
jgi:hypothetical protein